MRRFGVCVLFLCVACKSEPSAEPVAAPPAAAEPDPNGDGEGLPPGDPGPSEQLSAADCEAAGGVVVGDIGDGAIFKPDYTCENGKPPRARIVADPGGPIGVEGSVCC